MTIGSLTVTLRLKLAPSQPSELIGVTFYRTTEGSFPGLIKAADKILS